MVTTKTSFSKFMLAEKASSLTDTIAIYPSTSTSVISLLTTSTEIQIKLEGSTTTVFTFTYSGKSTAEICREINLSALPVTAKELCEVYRLSDSDLEAIGSYLIIPDQFPITSRLTENGIVIKSKKVSIKHRALTSFYILPPYSQSELLPWYPRINNSSYIQRFENRTYHYSIPEFENQDWSIRYGRPIRDVSSERPIILSPRILKVARRPLYYDGSNIYIINNGQAISNSLIEDIDIHNGLIHFKEDIFSDPDGIQIGYNYIENTFEYKAININGHFSQRPDLLNKFVLLYLTPIEGSAYNTAKSSINHIVGFSVEECIASIPENVTKVPNLILGAYQIQPVFNPEEVSIVDTRSLGGGLRLTEDPIPVDYDKHNPIKNRKRLDRLPEGYAGRYSFWDQGRYDGEPYPGSAGILVDVPNYVTLPKDRIQSKVSKHFAAGITPIIEYTKRTDPLASGINTNISLFHNGYFTGDYHWLTDDYSLPQNNVFNSQTDYSIPKAISGSYATITSTTGLYQPYLISEPRSEVKWKQRGIITQINGETTYTEWENKTKVIYHTIPSGKNIVKSYVSFEKSQSPYQVSEVQVTCPYRLAKTGDLTAKVTGMLEGLYSAHSGLSNSTEELNSTVNTYISNIATLDTQADSDYIGTHPSNRFVRDIILTDLAGTYSGRLNDLTTDIAAFVDDTTIKFYAVEDNLLQNFNTETTVSVNTYLTDCGLSLKWMSENSPASRSEFLTNITGFMVNLDTNPSLGYVYESYKINNSSTLTVTPVPITLGETVGYSSSETKSDLNEDYKLTKMYPSLSSFSFGDITSTGELSALKALYTDTYSSFSDVIQQVTRGFTLGFEYENSQVMTGSYTSYGRYSTLAGEAATDIIESYTYLKSGLQTNNLFTGSVDLTGLSSSRTANIIIEKDLYQTMSGLEEILSNAYSYTYDYMTQNGVIEHGIEKLIYAYGWYANNASGYYNLTTSEIPTGTVSNYTDVYLEASKNLIKSAITKDGNIYGGTYLDMGESPSIKRSPYNLIQALTPGLQLDSTLYTVLIDNVLDYLSGECQRNWYFSSNLGSSQSQATDGYQLSQNLVKLYSEL